MSDPVISNVVEGPPLHDLTGVYALVIRNNNEVELVVPPLEDNDPLTDGHLLMLGLLLLLRQPGWASRVVEQTAATLQMQRAELAAEAELDPVGAAEPEQ